MTFDEALEQFFEDVPAVGLLGSQFNVHADKPYTVDHDVQLVCKYLQALKTEVTVGRNKKIKAVDRLYREGTKLLNITCFDIHVQW